VVLAVTAAYGLAVWYVLRKHGFQSIPFAVLAYWLTCCWWALISHGLDYRFEFPSAYHRARPWENQGKIYRWLGVRFFKWLLSRGPLGFFSARYAFGRRRSDLPRIELETRFGEAAHLLVFALSLAYPVYAVTQGWVSSALWLVFFNVVLPAPCIMLQRYNRPRIAALLAR
jgi:hypothetical protein